ncbi:hypothetical protein AXF42_Ash020805 [Apostasia shenzhenica]|uniref:Uncharacterized protein n=1 Tax=Apostasia shenzhenica TaxID=1088818 RepID=A0A2I0AZM6_9ASPA|nr:hypothetical protein AXF42_Ash020805 [Apostasia shenzhenica]
MTPTALPQVFIQVPEVRMASGHAHQCTSRLLGGHVTSGSAPPHPERTCGGSRGADVTSSHVEQGSYDVEEQTAEEHAEKITPN